MEDFKPRISKEEEAKYKSARNSAIATAIRPDKTNVQSTTLKNDSKKTVDNHKTQKSSTPQRIPMYKKPENPVIHQPATSNEPKKYTSDKKTKGLMKLLSVGIAAALGLGYAVGNIHSKSNEDTNTYVVALAKDNEGDEYDQAIPLESENGDIIEIPNNGVMIVKKGEIKNGNKKNKAYAVKNGKVVEGEVQGKYLTSSDIQISKKTLMEYNGVYKVTPEAGANLRDNPTIIHSNILKGVAQGEIVLGGDTIVSKDNEYLWKPVIYINENEVAKGYINKDLLEKVDTIQVSKNSKSKSTEEDTKMIEQENLDKSQVVEMKVNTNEDGGVPLHLREEPSINSNIILNIENGRNITVKKQELENMVESDGHTWVKVNVGTSEGYVSSKYLEEVQEQEAQHETNIISANASADEIKERVISNITVNKSGSVTGIDVSEMTPEQLDDFYKNGIGETKISTDTLGNVIIDDINGTINYVIIRIGGTFNLNSNFEMDNTEEKYLPLIKKCEELGIPYGLYYYSAAVNEYEAEQEYEKIKNTLKSIKGEIGDLKYNLLPFAVDVEVDDTRPDLPDRHTIGLATVQEMTDAKVLLTNKLKEYLNENVILYGSGKAITNCVRAPIIDLNDYIKRTGVTDLWITLPKEEFFGSKSGGVTDNIEATVKAAGMNIVIKQVILDGKSNDCNVDIDVIDKNKYIELIRGKNREQNLDEEEYTIGE